MNHITNILCFIIYLVDSTMSKSIFFQAPNMFTFVHPGSASWDQYYNLTIRHSDLSKQWRFSKGWKYFVVDAGLVKGDVIKFVICCSDEVIVDIVVCKEITE